MQEFQICWNRQNHEVYQLLKFLADYQNKKEVWNITNVGTLGRAKTVYIFCTLVVVYKLRWQVEVGRPVGPKYQLFAKVYIVDNVNVEG